MFDTTPRSDEGRLHLVAAHEDHPPPGAAQGPRPSPTPGMSLDPADLVLQGGLRLADLLGQYHRHRVRHLERLAGTRPTTLACMHSSSWRGDGGARLLALGKALAAD